MTTENQTIVTEKKSLLRQNRPATKGPALKTLSLKPSRSLKKSAGIKPQPLKLK